MEDQITDRAERDVPHLLMIEVPVFGRIRWSSFQWLTVNLPLAFIVAVWLYVLEVPWPRQIGLRAGIVTLASMLASVTFASVLLRALRKAYEGLESAISTASEQSSQLQALHEAGVAMTQDLDMDAVLGRVVDLSRTVLRARYAALQVAGGEDSDGGEASGHSFLTSGMTPDEISEIGELPTGRGVLGVVAAAGVSVRLDDLTRHPASVGFPLHHPVMRSLLGTPVRFRDRILGYIYLTEKENGDAFTEADEAALERFAAQAGAVIANARLYREVGRLAQAAERERIGRDLHDGTLQELYAIALRLQAAVVDANPGLEQPPVSREKDEAIGRAVESIRRVMADIRHYVFEEDLKAAPASLRRTLLTALQELGHPGGSSVRVDLDGLEGAFLPEERALSLVQVVREAVSNAIHHAKASRVAVSGRFGTQGIHLTVEDDGIGFDAEALETVGHGLSNMKVRVTALGGRLTFASLTREGRHGTAVRIDVPDGGARYAGSAPGRTRDR